MNCRVACFLLPCAVALGENHLIVQKDRAFSKSEIQVRRGDSIVFKNTDEVVHNVFSNTPGLEFDIRRQSPGGSSSVAFLVAGTSEVRCAIHPKMKLIVKVQP